MDVILAAYVVTALGLVALVVVALRRPDDRAWLRRGGWMFVLVMVASIVFGVLSRLA